MSRRRYTKEEKSRLLGEFHSGDTTAAAYPLRDVFATARHRLVT